MIYNFSLHFAYNSLAFYLVSTKKSWDILPRLFSGNVMEKSTVCIF